MRNAPYSLHKVRGSTELQIRDRRTGRGVGYVKKVEGGLWRSRNYEGDSSPQFTLKTRKAAVDMMFNVWALLNNEGVAAL